MNWLSKKVIIPAVAGLVTLGGVGAGGYYWGSSNIEDELSRKHRAEISQVREELSQLKDGLSQENQRNSDIAEQLRRINDPEYGQLTFEDGENQSVRLNITPGIDFEGESLQITRDGEEIATVPSSAKTFVDSNGVEDGKEYAYTIGGLNPGNIETRSRFGGSFVPFDEAFDYQLNVDAKNKLFDQTGKIVVTPNFERYAKGDSVESATFKVRSLADSSVVDSSRFADLSEALAGFEMDAGKDSVVVEGYLDLARGGNREAVSDTLVAVEDMPQLVLEPIDGRKTIRGYQFAITDFNDKAQADSLVAKLSEDPTIGGTDTLWVNYAGNNANDLVGRWLLPNGSLVGSQDEAFRVEPKKATEGATGKWAYNPNYETYALDFMDDDRKHDAFKLARGNTVAGGLAYIAAENGIKLSDERLRELSDEVNIYERICGNPIENPDFHRLPVGTIVHLTPEVQDELYGIDEAAEEELAAKRRAEENLAHRTELAAIVVESLDFDGDNAITRDDYDTFREVVKDAFYTAINTPVGDEHNKRWASYLRLRNTCDVDLSGVVDYTDFKLIANATGEAVPDSEKDLATAVTYGTGSSATTSAPALYH